MAKLLLAVGLLGTLAVASAFTALPSIRSEFLALFFATRCAVRMLCAVSCAAEHDVHFGCGSMPGSMTGTVLSVVAFCIPPDPVCSRSEFLVLFLATRCAVRMLCAVSRVAEHDVHVGGSMTGSFQFLPFFIYHLIQCVLSFIKQMWSGLVRLP